jgi:hypothetical protein
VNPIIPCCYSVQPFSAELQWTSIHSATSFFTELQCSTFLLNSVIPHATLLSHFSLSNNAKSFVNGYTELSHLHCSIIFHWAIMLYNKLNHFLLKCTVILWFYQSFSRFCQVFCYSALSFNNFVSHSQDHVSYFTIMLNHFAKLLSHSWVSVSHSLKWLMRAREVEGGSDRGCTRVGDGLRFGRDSLWVGARVGVPCSVGSVSLMDR